MSRYDRQILLPQIGAAGQRALSESRVLLVGCGALGTAIADQLARAGVGWLRIVDRDIVELSNLQRQVLFDEQDARDGLPKAVAAAERLRKVNSEITLDARVVDLHAGNIEELAGLEGDGPRVDLILDGTDNAETRYLINDVSVKHGVPWVYGACVGTEGRVLAVRPPATACLRCLFEQPPQAGELPTCDTAGVLGPAAGVVASLQSAAAIKILSGHENAVAEELISLDVWINRVRAISTAGAKRADCPACGRREFEFLTRKGQAAATSLCGRNAVQVRPAGSTNLDLEALATKLSAVATVQRSRYVIRCVLRGDNKAALTLFPDGRMIVHGTSDPGRARALYARYVGS